MSDFDDDDYLLEQLSAAIAEHDPVPDSAISFAQNVHRLLGVQAELAQIETDSLVGAEGMRSTDVRRTIVFSRGELAIRIEVSEQTEGTVTPNDGAIELQLSDGSTTTVRVSDSGYFSFPTPSTSFRLMVTTEQGSVVTEWVRA